jgi:NAD(P)-dependent dehydrogenase (short-subunit alcohol dehydrogenase family)
MNGQFRGKVALVTGGNSGLGKATALAFAKEGAKVVISARRAKEGAQVAQLIKDAGGEALFVRADMSKKADIEALIARTVESYGRLDFAVNNAGIEGTLFVPTAEYSEDTWDEVININLKGVWLCMKYEIPHILKQKGGSIVNMSSVAGLVGGP